MDSLHISIYVLGLLVFLALVFDFMNGFHDAANAIATVVSTGVLKPQTAVAMSALFNFVAIFTVGLHVAATVGKGTIDPAVVDHYVVFGALVGAIIWNVITWYYGIPSSSSHALIGGLAGAGVTYGGWGILVKSKLYLTMWFIPLAPVIGFILAYLLMLQVFWMLRRKRPRSVDRFFRVGQLVSSGLYSIGHGGNDAQKTMGIIVALLIASGHMQKDFDHVPIWIAIASYGCMALGTAMGGWRIVKTMGMRLTKLRPVGGFCAEVAGAITLFGATYLHIPVSTTHTITGSIIGVGSTTKMRGIRWGLASRIVWAWVFTIPLSAGMASVTFLGLHWLHLW